MKSLEHKKNCKKKPELAKCSTYPLHLEPPANVPLKRLSQFQNFDLNLATFQCKIYLCLEKKEHLSNVCIYGSRVWRAGDCFSRARGCQGVAALQHLFISFLMTRERPKDSQEQNLHLVSLELPRKVEAWSPEEEENWDRISANSKITHWLDFHHLVVTGDSEELLGPDAGMFAYNGSEFAS